MTEGRRAAERKGQICAHTILSMLDLISQVGTGLVKTGIGDVLAGVSISTYQIAPFHGLNSCVTSSWQLWLILVGSSFWTLDLIFAHWPSSLRLMSSSWCASLGAASQLQLSAFWSHTQLCPCVQCSILERHKEVSFILEVPWIIIKDNESKRRTELRCVLNIVPDHSKCQHWPSSSMVQRGLCIDFFLLVLVVKIWHHLEKCEMVTSARKDYWVYLALMQSPVSIETKQRKFVKESLENR